MDIKRIRELRTELDAERISYGELIEIQEAFEQIDPATLPEPAENAMAGDMLDELEARATPELTRTQKAALTELEAHGRLWPTGRGRFRIDGARYSHKTLQTLVDAGRAEWTYRDGVMPHIVPVAPVAELEISTALTQDGTITYSVGHPHGKHVLSIEHDTARVATYWHAPEDGTASYLVVDIDSESDAPPLAVYVNDGPAVPPPGEVTDTERVAYALSRLHLWESNYRANAETERKRGNATKALRLTIEGNTIADVIKMLDGTDDSYIRQLEGN